MVTTRRQTRKRKSDGADGLEDASILTSPAPASTDSPKRQKKLPVRAKSGKAAARSAQDDDVAYPEASSPPPDSSFVVEIPARSASASDDVLSVADGEETTITGQEQPAPEPEIEEPSSQPKATVFTGTKKTFGDDDDVAEVEDDDATGEKLAIAPSISEPSDDESDSDEAPEAVSTSKAAVAAIQSAKAANKAIAEQAQAQKRKRQERTARLQSQAQTRKAPATPAAAEASSSSSSPASDADTPMDDITPRTQLHLESAAAYRKSRPPTTPSLLPESYLASDSEGSDDEAAAEGASATRPRKARKLANADRQLARGARRAAAPAPDRVVGSTLYRAAAKKRDERLAPSGGKASANAKRNLLVRGRAATQAKKGFFV